MGTTSPKKVVAAEGLAYVRSSRLQSEDHRSYTIATARATCNNMPNRRKTSSPSQPPPYHPPFRQVQKHQDPPPSSLSTSSPSVSQFRTTNRPPNTRRGQLSSHIYFQARGYCTSSTLMASIHPSECQECAQSCEDRTCSVELTPQCTNQCVVVACNETHHDPTTCENCARSPPCELMCTDSDECPGLEEIVSDHKSCSVTWRLTNIFSSFSVAQTTRPSLRSASSHFPT